MRIFSLLSLCLLYAVSTATDPTIRLFQRILQISQKIEELPSIQTTNVPSGSKPKIHMWPGPDIRPIPYDITAVPDSLKLVIQAAIDFWSQYTCVRWQPDNLSPDRLTFQYGSECFAPIGFLKESHLVSLSPYCNHSGLVARQIGHTLGLVHEHRRPNRNDFITINFKNVRPNHRIDFLQYEANQLGPLGDNTTYDIGSIMHFDGVTSEFAVLKTDKLIYTKNPLYQRTMGQRKSPTFTDIRRINSAYCPHVCQSQTLIECRYGGYPNPNNCSECLCPSGLGGVDCTTSAPSTEDVCGGELTAEPEWITLSSPRLSESFSNPMTITSCNWLIRADSPIHVEFNPDQFNLPCNDVCDSYVEVKMGPDLTATGYRLCCQEQLKDAIFTADSGVVVILLRTKAMRGFSARYRADPAGFLCSNIEIGKDQNGILCKNITKNANHSDTLMGPYLDHNSSVNVTFKNHTVNHTNSQLTMGFNETFLNSSSMGLTTSNSTNNHNFSLLLNATHANLTSADSLVNLTRRLTGLNHNTTNITNATLANSPFFGSFLDKSNFNLSSLNISEIDECQEQNCSLRRQSPPFGNVTAMLQTINESECSQWSPWTPCNYKCGGCGRKVRFRTCTPDKFSSFRINDMEETACGLLPCTFKGHPYTGHVIGTVKMKISFGCCDGFTIFENCCNQTAVEPIDILTDIDEFTQNRYFRARSNERCTVGLRSKQ